MKYPEVPDSIEFTCNRENLRLDAILHLEFPRLSRNKWRLRIQRGDVKINGKPACKGTRPGIGTRIRVDFSENRTMYRPSEGTTEKGPSYSHHGPSGYRGRAVDICYEDQWIVAVNKPAGLPSHPLRDPFPGSQDSILDLLAAFRPEVLLPKEENDGWLERNKHSAREGGLLHRLDNGTSGILLFAKSHAAYEVFLPHMRRGRKTQFPPQKYYIAIVAGCLNPPLPLIIQYPIAHGKSRRCGRMVCVNHGTKAHRGTPRNAESTVICAAPAYKNKTLLLLRIEHGQRHQIRCHLAASGHPVVNDWLYGEKDPNTQIEEDIHFLHHWQMEIHHPFLAKNLVLHAPPPAHFYQEEPKLNTILSKFTWR